jgi:hypothetical protein
VVDACRAQLSSAIVYYLVHDPEDIGLATSKVIADSFKMQNNRDEYVEWFCDHKNCSVRVADFELISAGLDELF